MLALYLKEVRGFLSSLIGHIVIGVFLLLTGLFLWVFDGSFNVFEGAEASLYNLFYLAPYVFLFLIPAITMRTFAEEKKQGTLELLLTKPISDNSIIASKFLAGFTLVIVSILPTFLYYIAISALKEEGSVIDSGEMWGSYIGLGFLGGAYVSIGIFASSISSNQVVGFIVALSLCWFFFMGFDYIGSYEFFGSNDELILGLGIYEHYTAVSYGVIDSRDVLYFLSLIFFFLLSTKVVIASRKW